MPEMSSDDVDLPTDLFEEPPGYFPPPPPNTYTSYTLTSGQVLNLRLVGHNPLWVYPSTISPNNTTPISIQSGLLLQISKTPL